jgi:hypothetical protein
MLRVVSSDVMRTTIDLDAPILKELKRLQKAEGKSLGRLVSDLLGAALSARHGGRRPRPAFRWIGHDMGARVDLADKDAVYRALDDDGKGRQ